MATQAEEIQAKEFLKRAEIRTMKKDLLELREGDSLKERDKIAKIKTLEEQQAEQQKKLQVKEAEKLAINKAELENVLQKNAAEEKIAEKDLKNYATEEERQQIFLLESQRLGFENQAYAIDKDRDPALKLEKNKLLLQKRDWQTKLNAILEQEKKLEGEQGFVAQKSQSTAIASEKKALEERRWEIEKEIQEIEKKRWEVEKQIENIDNKVRQIDKASEQLASEKNGLRDKILGIDKSIREIYSGVINRVEEKRRVEEEERKTAASDVAKIRTKEKEKIQRQQWAPTATTKQQKSAIGERFAESVKKEEEQRKKFLHNVESWDQNKEEDQPKILQQTQPAQQTQQAPMVPIPPVPRKR